MTKIATPTSPNKLWPKSASSLLIAVGLALSAISFAAVLLTGPSTWHPARDAELRATYETYQDTGTLLIKPTGSGSYGVQAPAPGPLTFATWDDDPGAYIIASLMSHVTGSDSPYPGLMLAQAFLVALPLIWLPTAVARLFRKVRAGLALILIPPVMWLVNHGTILLGTEYGMTDSVSTLGVYALYGMAASFAFLSLSLIFLLSTYRLRPSALIGATLLIGVLAGFGNLTRSLSGLGVAAAIGVLWWLHYRGRRRWVAAVAASLLTIMLATAVSTGVMTIVNEGRVATTGQAMDEVPDAHTAWHSLYLGLSYPQPITGGESHFDVTWSDEFGWEKAREVDPGVLVASEEYDAVLKDLYLEKVLDDPLGALKLYVLKAVFLLQHFGAMLVFIAAGMIAAIRRSKDLRRPLGTVVLITVPTVLLGLVPPIMVMPLLYYYSELSAALGLLTAVSLGAIAWTLTSWPSHVREQDRTRLRERSGSVQSTEETAATGTSVVIQSSDAILSAHMASGLAEQLSEADEVILVVEEDAGTDAVTAIDRLSEEWAHGCRLLVLHSAEGIGDSLRTGVSASSGKNLLLCSDEDSVDIGTVPSSGFGATLASTGERRNAASTDRGVTEPTRTERFLREALWGSLGAGDYDTVLVDGHWARKFATVSREKGRLWLDELVLTAESQGIPVSREEPTGADAPARLIRWKGGWHALRGIVRLALHKDEFRGEPWAGHPVPTAISSAG